jgi:hypothetical protein
VDVEKWVRMEKPDGVREIPASEGIIELLKHEHEAHRS